MRRVSYGLVAVLGMLIVADTAAARPFGYIWEKRKAELYARLSRDVSVRVNARVNAAKKALQDSLDAQVADEAAKLQEQAEAGAQELDARFGEEIHALDEAFAVESKALRERFDLQLQDLKKKVDADVAAASAAAAAKIEVDAKQAVADAAAVNTDLQKDVTAKTEAEIKRIEQQSAVEIKNILAATEKKVDLELTKMKAHIDQQVAEIAKRLEADRAAAEKKPAEAEADVEGGSDSDADAAD